MHFDVCCIRTDSGVHLCALEGCASVHACAPGGGTGVCLCVRPENTNVSCKRGCVQAAQGLLSAGSHGSEGVNICHGVDMYGRSELCAHRQANVCEIWACANICLCKDAHLGLGHDAVHVRSGHAHLCEYLGACTRGGLCVCM